jgi:hypothetical protein
VTQSVAVDSDGSSTVAEVQSDAETALGLGAGLVMFNIILAFFINLLQLLPAACVLGTSVYMFDKGTRSPDGGMRAARACVCACSSILTHARPGIVVSRGIWVTAALIVVTVHLVVPVALSPAVLIFVHRNGIEAFWWVGVTWIVQWVGGLVAIGFALFRRVELAASKGARSALSRA